MRKNLPYLNKDRLNIIFDHVYETAGGDRHERAFKDQRLSDLLDTLHSMQSFNYRHRPDDTGEMFGVVYDVFDFERNSEGTTLWLALILAIKEFYGFSDKKLVSVMKLVSVRK